MLGAQLLNWGVARRYSEARCTWVQPSRNDRPSEEEVRNRERIHHNFHLLLRAACSVLLHPNPSAHLIVRLLQWAQSTGFVPCSSFLVPSCRPGRATQATALPNVAHCPASRLLQQTIDSSSVCHLPPPLLAVPTLLQVCPSLTEWDLMAGPGGFQSNPALVLALPLPWPIEAHLCFRLGSPCYLRPALPPDYQATAIPRC